MKGLLGDVGRQDSLRRSGWLSVRATQHHLSPQSLPKLSIVESRGPYMMGRRPCTAVSLQATLSATATVQPRNPSPQGQRLQPAPQYHDCILSLPGQPAGAGASHLPGNRSTETQHLPPRILWGALLSSILPVWTHVF